MSLPDTIDSGVEQYKLNFELTPVEDDGSINARLTNLLFSRGAKPDPSIWGDFDFESDWYRAEVEICHVLCQKFALVQYPGISMDKWETVKSDLSILRGRMQDLIEQVNKPHVDAPEMQEAEAVKARIEIARKQWKLSASLLSWLEMFKIVNRTPTGTRCEDRINKMLWHLLIYRNGVDMSPDLRNMTTSHIQNMARLFRLNHGNRVVKPKSTATDTSFGAKTGAGTGTVKKPRKTREGQSAFSQQLRKLYKCERYDGSERWCPVTQEWISAKQTIAAHIVPFGLGQDLAEQLFGKGISLMDSRNGIYLHEAVEDAFDNAQLAILPRQRDDGYIIEGSFEAVILDTKLLDQTYGDQDQYSWSDIHRRELDFRRGVYHRPARRFLYFHLLFAAVRLSLNPRPGWAENFAHLLYQPAFPTNGDYLQKGILKNIAKVIGNSDVEQRVVDFIPAESPHTEVGLQIFGPGMAGDVDEACQEALGCMAAYWSDAE